MTPTAWDLRNKLLAILNEAKHSGKPYLDLESDSLYSQIGGDPSSKPRRSICHDVMTPDDASWGPSSQRIPKRRRRDAFGSL